MLRRRNSRLRGDDRLSPAIAEALESRRMLAFVVPALSSRPGAPVTLWIDFDGTPAFDWAGGGGGTTRVHGPAAGTNDPVPAFSIDATLNDFSQAELDGMTAIWRHASEKFSPFNINVTTVPPPNLNDGAAIQMVVGGSNSDWYGSGGGVAPINGFTNGNSNTGFVWSADSIDAGSVTLNNGDRHFIAETVAHEAGHLFGLEHQSVIDGMGNVAIEYSSGGPFTAPVMGNSSNNSGKRGIWFSGPASKRDGNNNLVSLGNQDDLGVLTRPGNFITYRPDDFGSYSGSGSLNVNQSTGVASGGGVIETNGDQDAFTFVAIGPVLSFTVSNFAEGGMLAPTLELIPISGNSPAVSLTTNNTSATLSTNNATPGQGFVLRVSPQNNEYGSLGQYTITGNVGIFAGLNGNQLVVTGYNANNDIGISYHSSTDRIVIQNDVFGGSAVQFFPRTSVGSILVNCQAGNDFIDVFGQFSGWNIPITANGGGGDDYLIFQGTTGNDFQVLETATFGRNNQTPVTFSGIEKFIMTAFDGYDTQRLYEVPSTLAVTVYGGGHDDGFDLGYGDVERIRGPVNYSGDGGYDTLVVQNEYATGDWYHNIGSNYVGNYKTGFAHDTYVNTAERIIVGASHNNDSVWASPFASFSYLMYGRGGNDTFDIQGGSSAELYGGNGNDRFYFGGGNLGPAISSVYAYGEAGDDVMVLDDHLSTHDFPWAVFGNTGDPNTANTVFLGLNAYTYSAFEGVEVLGGNGSNDFQIYSSSVPVTLRGGGGNDQFRFLQTSGGIVDMTLDGQGGTDYIIADDRNVSAGVSILEWSATYLRRWAGWGIFAVPYTSNYTGVESITYYGHSITNTAYVYGTSPTPAGMQHTIFLNSLSDSVILSPHDATGNLTINGTLGIGGGGGSDTLFIQDQYSSNPINYRFYNQFGPGTTNISGMGAGGFGVGSDVENINITGSSGDDTFTVDTFKSGSSLVVNGGPGNDSFDWTPVSRDTVPNVTAISYFSFDGGDGYDYLNFFNDNNASAWNYYRTSTAFSPYRASGGYYLILNDPNVESTYATGSSNNDQVFVQQVRSGGVFYVDGAGGSDNYFLTNAQSTQGIEGLVGIYASAGTDSITIDDRADIVGRTVHISEYAVGAVPGDDLFGPGGSLSYAGIAGAMTLKLGSGADTVYASPHPYTPLFVEGNGPNGARGGGLDSIGFAFANALNPFYLPGAPGEGMFYFDNAAPFYYSGMEIEAIDDAAPTVVASGYDFQTPSVTFQFSEDVSSILDPSFLAVTNLTTNDVIASSNIAVAYDGGTNTATFTFPSFANGMLPDGNYHFDLLAGLQDLYGNPVASSSAVDDFALAGDANRDRSVDISDLAVLATHWQGSGKTFSEGDFNFDGTVDISDLAILATNWQTSLPVPAGTPLATPHRPVRKLPWERAVKQVGLSDRSNAKPLRMVDSIDLA